MKFLLAVYFTALGTLTVGFAVADEGLNLVTRDQWGAKPPKSAPSPLKEIPPPYVIISHTTADFCFTQSHCILRVSSIQTNHMIFKGWDDIGYNFLVGGDGNVYEGRGWDVTGAHAAKYNVKSIGISFIGNFDTTMPTDAQLAAAKNLIKYGLENGKISKEYKLLGHRQVSNTQSPGQKLYETIQTWDHWSPAP